jgi:hypothetical protein
MKFSDALTFASTLIAGLALVFAGWQLLILNRQARYERRVAYDGVVVAWQPTEAPHRPHDDGNARWTYQITASNPGRLPIDRVNVKWVFPRVVQRRHRSGNLDGPSNELILTTPVLAGGATRTWNREIQMPFANHPLLQETYAEIEYVDIDGITHRNRWPRTVRS